MSDPDWLSLTEIAQLWSDETGESAEAFERDLDAWFSEFAARESSQQLEAPGRDGDTTNLLMAMLGGRHLQRETFAIYCEERGLAMPNFWFAGNADAREPLPPLPSDSSTGAAGQSPTEDTRDAGPAQRQYEEAWAAQAGFYVEPAQPAAETTNEPPYPAAHRPAPGAPAATPEPAGLAKARSGLSMIWRAAVEVQRDATARLLIWVRALPLSVRALPLSVRGLRGLEATRIVGGLALGLALLAAGFALGQGEVEQADRGPDMARSDEAQRALVSSLRSELEGARHKIAGLATALEASEKEVAWLTTDLLGAQYVLSGAQETARFEATVTALENASSAELAAAAAETSRQELILAAQAASAHAALMDRALNAAQQRIANFETPLQTLEVKQTEQAPEVRDRSMIAPTQASPQHAASTARNASIQTLGAPDVGIGSIPPPMPPAPKPTRSKNPVEGEKEQQAAAEETPDPSSTNDVATAPSPARDAEDATAAEQPQRTAAAEFIDVDSLIANPNRYDTHQVVVTGSLLRLLQHYRLQSESGARTLIVDVAGIHRTQYEVLRDAIAEAGLIGSVRAQISGEVVRGSAKKFHLVASDLVLVE